MFRKEGQRSETASLFNPATDRSPGLTRSRSDGALPTAQHRVFRCPKFTVTRHASGPRHSGPTNISPGRDTSGSDRKAQTTSGTYRATLYIRAIAAAALLYHAYLFWAIYETWSRSTDWCHGTRLLVVVTIVVYATLLAHFGVRRASKQIEFISIHFQEKSVTASVVVWLLLVLLVLFHSLWDARKNPRTIIPVAGATTFVVAASAFSYNRSKIVWADVFRCIVLHYVTSAILLKWDVGDMVVSCVARKFIAFSHLTGHGSTFTFEHLAAGINMSEHLKGLAHGHNVTDIDAVFGFKLLPFYFFWGLLIQLIYWFGFTRHAVLLLSRCIHVVTGATICEGIAAMSSVFLSSNLMMLTLEPFIDVMTLSELFTAMTLGFSSITVRLMPVYGRLSGEAKHVQSSVILSILSALICAKIVCPEHDKVKITFEHFPSLRRAERSALEAASKGSVQGLRIAGLILAALISFNSLFRLVDAVFVWVFAIAGVHDVSLEWAAGVALTPVAFMTGVRWRDCRVVGSIIAVKILFNEYAAIHKLKDIRHEELQQRSRVLATYAICSFGNVVESTATAGALTVLRTRRVEEVVALALPALATGCVVSLYNACIVGVFIP